MKIQKVRKQNRIQEIAPVVKRQELNAIAPVMAENYICISPNQKARLNKEQLADLIIMLAEDATIQAIVNKFKSKYQRNISTNTINKYKKKYEANIFEMAKNFETLSAHVGLRKKENRLRKMQRLAEALEETIYDPNDNLHHGASSKIISEYRETLKQIALETGGIDTAQTGDIIFANVSDADLKALVANKLGGNKSLSVILAETAGVRPTAEPLPLDGMAIDGMAIDGMAIEGDYKLVTDDNNEGDND